MKTEFRKAVPILLPVKNLKEIKEGTLMLHRSYDGDTLRIFPFSIQEENHVWIPNHIHIYLDKEIVNKGMTTAVCLDEIAETPKDAIVFIVGNCHGCREIIISSDESLTDESVHKISYEFVAEFMNAHNQNKPIKLVEVEYEEMLGDQGIVAVALGEDDFKIKTNYEDVANIRPVKNNYTRDEVIALFNEYMEDTVTKNEAFKKIFKAQLDKWIDKRF